MILVTGSFVAKESRIAKVLQLSLEHVRRSRLEPGCISHGVHQDAENPSRFVFFERWTDRAALAAHFAVPESRAFAKAVSGLATAAPEISIYDAAKIDR